MSISQRCFPVPLDGAIVEYAFLYVVGFPFYNCDVSELFQTKFFVKVVQFLVMLFCGDVGINERD